MTELCIRGVSSQDAWDHENGYYWFSDAKRLGKFVSHYELYKSITGLAGDVLEFGVYKGASLIRWLTFRALLEAEHSRRVIGFDAFGCFPHTDNDTKEDKKFIKNFELEGGDGLSLEEMQRILFRKNMDNYVELIAGDVHATLNEYLVQNPQTRASLLHLDMDVYSPTRFVLDKMWDRVVPGGLIVIDDYNAVEGATRAVDEFLDLIPGAEIKKLSVSDVPAFIRKA